MRFMCFDNSLFVALSLSFALSQVLSLSRSHSLVSLSLTHSISLHLLCQGFPCDVADLQCHPTKPLVAFTCADPGSLQIWNYDMKLLMNLREFAIPREKEQKGKPQALKPSKTQKISNNAKGGNIDPK
jgi:hypothetical protein